MLRKAHVSSHAFDWAQMLWHNQARHEWILLQCKSFHRGSLQRSSCLIKKKGSSQLTTPATLYLFASTKSFERHWFIQQNAQAHDKDFESINFEILQYKYIFLNLTNILKYNWWFYGFGDEIKCENHDERKFFRLQITTVWCSYDGPIDHIEVHCWLEMIILIIDGYHHTQLITPSWSHLPSPIPDLTRSRHENCILVLTSSIVSQTENSKCAAPFLFRFSLRCAFIVNYKNIFSAEKWPSSF